VKELVREHLVRGGMAVMTTHQEITIDAPTAELDLDAR
jgi:ABC-type transport system involved in cytochrome c biogenesis ATPase subunit